MKEIPTNAISLANAVILMDRMLGPLSAQNVFSTFN